MDAVTSFYSRLITSESPIEPVLQVRIVEHLVRVKDFVLLGSLAARRDTSVEVDSALCLRKEAQVLAGWASRPGRTVEELTSRLAGEKRVSTLLPLARMEGLPEHIYREIAKRDSVKLTEALMTNTSVPSSIKISLVREIAAILDDKNAWQAAELLRRTSGDDPEIRKALVTVSLSEDVILPGLDDFGFGLPSGVVANLVERIEEIRTKSESCATLLTRLAVEDLDAASVRRLRLLAGRLAKEEKSGYSYWKPSYDGAKHLLSGKGRDDAARIRRLATSTDPSESLTLLRELLGNGKALDKYPHKDAVFPAIAANAVLPAEVVAPLVDEFSHEDQRRMFALWARRGEFSTLAPIAMESYGQPWFLDVVADQGALLAAVVAHARAADEDVPQWVFSHPAVYGSPETALSLLPWRNIREVTSVDVYGSEPAADPGKGNLVVSAAQKLIVERLGTDAGRWEVFSTLANEFEGSLIDLLDAVEAIAA